MREVGRQASENTKYHALYGYYFLGFSRAKLAHIYRKAKPTIANWINQYESEGSVARKSCARNIYKKFSHEKRKFLLKLYNDRPVLYLSEAKEIFQREFDMCISVSSMSYQKYSGVGSNLFFLMRLHLIEETSYGSEVLELRMNVCCTAENLVDLPGHRCYASFEQVVYGMFTKPKEHLIEEN